MSLDVGKERNVREEKVKVLQPMKAIVIIKPQ
jgi:hypothetical protein